MSVRVHIDSDSKPTAKRFMEGEDGASFVKIEFNGACGLVELYMSAKQADEMIEAMKKPEVVK